MTHGLNDDALQEMLEKKEYGENRLIAEAVQPEDGEDGMLVFHFSKDERTGRPREVGGGRVDYRSLDLYEPVTEGQLLLTRTFATTGAPGVTV
ncbi:MAG: FapA family protein, partial [Treponema sp.]|nr:FapA family protein [Treponema sp.]